MSVTLDGDIGDGVNVNIDRLKSSLTDWLSELIETAEKVDSIAKIKIEFRLRKDWEGDPGLSPCMKIVMWESVKVGDELSRERELEELIQRIDRINREIKPLVSIGFSDSILTEFAAVCNFYAYNSIGACVAYGSWSQEWEQGWQVTPL